MIKNNSNIINKKDINKKNKKNEPEKFMKNITKYFLLNTEENSIFKIIQNNIYKFCNIQKTLILISDSFSFEEDKKYMVNILNKISKSKIPIIILTNSQPIILNNSKKNNKLVFSNISSRINKKLFIYHFFLILYLYLLLEEIMNNKINSMDEMIFFIKDKINSENIEKKDFNKIYEIIYKLSHKCKYDMESMGYLLKNKLEKIKSNEGDIKQNILLLEEQFNEKNKIKYYNSDLYSNYEYRSFKDVESTKIEKYSNKLFSILNNYENGVNLENIKIENNYDLYKLQFNSYSLESENMKKIINSPINKKIYFMKLNFNPSISRNNYIYYDTILKKLNS